MTVKALFPGTFDPIHYGHLDIARRAARLFDEVVIAVYDRPMKSLIFPPEERIELARLTITDDPKIAVVGYSGLTVDFCHKIGAQVIVRGLRVFSDFEYEFQLANMNRAIYPEFESIFLTPSEHLSYISSSLVREIAALHGDISPFVPAQVAAALKNRFAAN